MGRKGFLATLRKLSVIALPLLHVAEWLRNASPWRRGRVGVNSTSRHDDDVILIEQIIMRSPTDLGMDTDTSVVSSVRLHLVSEHRMPAALFMDELTAERHHYDTHLAQIQPHPVTDVRFRPGRLMATLRSQYSTFSTPDPRS
jgi:hypothetical protein